MNPGLIIIRFINYKINSNQDQHASILWYLLTSALLTFTFFFILWTKEILKSHLHLYLLQCTNFFYVSNERNTYVKKAEEHTYIVTILIQPYTYWQKKRMRPSEIRYGWRLLYLQNVLATASRGQHSQHLGIIQMCSMVVLSSYLRDHRHRSM